LRPDDQQDLPLWRALDESAVGRLATSMSTPFATATPSSRVSIAWQGVQERWRSLRGHTQMETVGIVMIAAALVHLGLAALRQPVGFWWLIVPGTVLMFGLTAVGLSRLGRSPR
jgi:hypothetical protein